VRKSFWIIILFILLTSSLSAQQPVLEQKLNLKFRNETLKKVLDSISSETGLFFSYNPQEINDSVRVTVIARDKPLSDILDNLSERLDFRYSVLEKQIILSPSIKIKPQQKTASTYTLAGHVVDSASNEILIGALIYIDGQFRTFSNEYGFFSLKLSQGKHLVVIDFMGYRKYRQIIDMESNLNMTFKLVFDPRRLDMVVVTPSDNTPVISQNPLDKVNYNRSLLKANPGLAGSYDAMKNLQAIPVYGDGSVIFHVRGGDRSQNLILIDDAPIFNPAHLLGFFSVVSPSAVNNINVYKNDLPIQYWGRTSSVIDIRIREGDYYKTGFQAETGPFLSSFTFDGPIEKGKSSFLLSVRTSNINWLNKINPSLFKVKFYDTHLKFNFKPNHKNKYSFSLFSGNDYIFAQRDFYARSMWWGNIAFAARWNHIFNNKIFSNTTFYTGRYSYFLSFDVDTANVFNSMLYQTGLKTNFTYYSGKKHTVNFGYGISYLYFNPANINDLAYIPSSNAMEYVIYAGDQINLSDKWKINFGVNLHKWDNVGPTVVYTYNNYLLTKTDTIGVKVYNSFLNSEPRASVTYALSDNSVIKLSAGHYVQYLQLLSNSISPFTTVEAWTTSDNNTAPQQTDQISLGIYKRAGLNEISVEAYAKQVKNLVFMIDHSSLLFNSSVVSNIRQGELASAGIEFFLRKTKGNFNYWISFTYSRTAENIPDLTGNYWFWASYDKPINSNISLTYKKERWNANATWVYSSGGRYTAPVGYYDFLDHKIPVYQYPYNMKMPDYNRLDMSFTYRLNKNPQNRFKHMITFSIYNVYGRKNPVLISFNKIEGPDGDFYVPGNYIYEYELTPAYYYLLKFVPSVTYSFSIR